MIFRKRPSHTYLDWTFSLGGYLPDNLMRLLYLLPHDTRRHFIKATYPKLYWTLMNMRQGDDPNFDYSYCQRLSTIFIHIPKAAGMYVSKEIIQSPITHFTAMDYQLMFGSEVYQKLFKFTFVRNPWERIVSAFFFLKNGGISSQDKMWSDIHLTKYSDFEEFITDLPSTKYHTSWIHFIPQHKFITDPFGRIIIDYIGKTENIKEDIKYISSKIGIKTPDHKRKENPSNHEHYKNYYNKKTKLIIESIYKKDILLFDYEY